MLVQVPGVDAEIASDSGRDNGSRVLDGACPGWYKLVNNHHSPLFLIVLHSESVPHQLSRVFRQNRAGGVLFGLIHSALN